MAGRIQDIYRSRERDRLVVEPRPSPEGKAEWLRKATGSRLRTWAYVLSLVLFLVVLLGIIVYQQRLLSAGREDASGNPPGPPQIEVAPRGPAVAFDESGRVMFDELRDVVPVAPPAEGPVPMTAHWVKQAAFHLRRAEVAYQDSRWEEALDHYGKALRLLPGLEDVADDVGLACLRVQRYAEAEQRFAAALAGDPESAGLRNNLGVAQMGQGRNAEAAETFRGLAGAQPEYAPAAHNLGLLHYRQGDMAQAAEWFAKATAADPKNVDILNMYAMALIRQEQWAEAVKALLRSADLAPAAAPVHFRLAQARSRAGVPDEAMESLRRAVGMVDARLALQWLNRKEFDALRGRPDFESLVSDLTRPIR